MANKSSVDVSCDGKKSFESYSLAEHVLKRCRAKHDHGTIYKCRYCHKFHIGTSATKRKRRPRIDTEITISD
jgi:hypothetical protein